MIKILLVDDEYHVINHLSSLLQTIDYCEIDIRKTISAPEAIQIIASTQIDIAILDINMPKINGLQIADKLYHQWPNCQIIFLTAYKSFDYIYEANQYPGAIYLLKAESDVKILDTVISCCETTIKKREEKSHLTEYQRKEQLLLLLQEQQLLRELLHENSIGDLERFSHRNGLKMHLSFEKEIYLLLMRINKSPSSYCDVSFYMDKMEHLLGNLFLFTFLETEKGTLLWIFQEKENPEEDLSYFDCLKDSLDSFLDICSHKKHQTLSLCLYHDLISWQQIPLSYQFLYAACHQDSSLLTTHSSIARVIEPQRELPRTTDSAYGLPMDSGVVVTPPSLLKHLDTIKHALYQDNWDSLFASLEYCRQYCCEIKSMHNVRAIKIYYSIVVIYLEYIEHYRLEPKIAMEVALYPLYHINNFPDWKHAFGYLRHLSEIMMRIVSENKNDKNKQIVVSIQNYIRTHLADELNLTIISEYVNYNDSYISRLFKRHTGNNLSEYITACRIEAAKSLLSETEDTIQIISQKTGFHTSQYFSSCFRKSVGISPNEFRVQKQQTASINESI